MSSKFDQIRPWSVELAALERLKKSFTYMYLRTIQNIFMTFWLAGERSLPFGLLVTIYGHGGHLGHVSSIMFIDFHFHVPESLHAKIG